MPARSSSLIRLLLAASIPFSLAGGAVVVPLAALSGCSCGEVTTVFPISKTDHDQLLARYGSDGIPASECQTFCHIPADADAGSDAGRGGLDGRDITFRECSVTSIELDTPALLCTGAPPCEG
jgi:hypothetical protein